MLWRLQEVKDLADWPHGRLPTHQPHIRARVSIHLLEKSHLSHCHHRHNHHHHFNAPLPGLRSPELSGAPPPLGGQSCLVAATNGRSWPGERLGSEGRLGSSSPASSAWRGPGPWQQQSWLSLSKVWEWAGLIFRKFSCIIHIVLESYSYSKVFFVFHCMRVAADCYPPANWEHWTVWLRNFNSIKKCPKYWVLLFFCVVLCCVVWTRAGWRRPTQKPGRQSGSVRPSGSAAPSWAGGSTRAPACVVWKEKIVCIYWSHADKCIVHNNYRSVKKQELHKL